MAEDTLLAHLAGRFVTQRENLATEALAYLSRSDAVVAAIRRHAGQFCPGLAPVARFDTHSFDDVSGGIPDMVGRTADGRQVLLIEARFGAALTANQPVGYLRSLLTIGETGLLLFLVPERRASRLWSEVSSRCHEAGCRLEERRPGRATVEGAPVAVGITTWTGLLDEIEQELVPGQHPHERITPLNPRP